MDTYDVRFELVLCDRAQWRARESVAVSAGVCTLP